MDTTRLGACIGLSLMGLFNSNLAVLQESQGILFFTQMAFFYLCATLLRNQSQQRLFLSSFLSTLTVVALYGLWQAFGGFQQMAHLYQSSPEEIPENIKNNSILLSAFLSKINTPRVYSVFTNPNILASYLLCAVPFFFYCLHRVLLEKTKNLKIFLLLILLVIPITALFLTKSRSAGLLFIFCPIWMACGKTSKIKFWTLAFLTSITLVCVLYLQPWKALLPNSFQSRLDYWETTWQIIQEFPLLGCGWGNFSFVFFKHLDPGGEVTRYAHNHWLQLASEIGAPAALLIVGGILWILSIQPPPSKEDSKEEFSLRPLTYLTLFIAAMFVFYPPFTILPLEYTPFFSIAAALLFFGLTLLYARLLQKCHFTLPQFASTCAALLFLNSLVEFHLDTLALSVFFFGFLGIGNPISGVSPKNLTPYLGSLKFNGRFLFSIFLVLGIAFTLTHLVETELLSRSQTLIQQDKSEDAAAFLKDIKPYFPLSKEIQFQESLLNLQISLSKHPENISGSLDNYLKMAKRFSKDYVVWMTLGKLALHFQKNRLLQKHGLQAVMQALVLAPANERLSLLEAQLLANNGNSVKASVILKSLLEVKDKKFAYIFLLNAQEKQKAKELLDTLP